MPNADDIRWFKQTFHREVAVATEGTPFDLDMLAAIACQETGEIWPVLRRKGLPVAEILALCVGDTLDESAGRSAFPRTKALLIAEVNGQAMFDIARRALVDMAEHIPAYQRVARNPDKFCHGFGIFQLDLQFFRTEPDHFLQRRYATFEVCAEKCVKELRNAMRRIGLHHQASLTDMEKAAVAIAYNTGGFRPELGLKQGHFDGTKFYGEKFFDFLQLAHTVPTPDGFGGPVVTRPTLTGRGTLFEVTVQSDTLRLRSEPAKSVPETANVIARLPNGQTVRAVTGDTVNGFLEVETALAGELLRGFASAAFLKPI